MRLFSLFELHKNLPTNEIISNFMLANRFLRIQNFHFETI